MESTSTTSTTFIHFSAQPPSSGPTEEEWKKALAEIESQEFDVSLNVLSGYRSFFRAVGSQPAVNVLLKAMRASGEVREYALGRIFDLSSLTVDPRYENPHDTALAVVLWLTLFTAYDHAELAASYVDAAPQCWYAKKLARAVLTPPPVASGNSRVVDSESVHINVDTSSGSQQLRMNAARELSYLWQHEWVVVGKQTHDVSLSEVTS